MTITNATHCDNGHTGNLPEIPLQTGDALVRR